MASYLKARRRIPTYKYYFDFTKLVPGGYPAANFKQETSIGGPRGLTYSCAIATAVQTSPSTVNSNIPIDAAAIGNKTNFPYKTGLIIQPTTSNVIGGSANNGIPRNPSLLGTGSNCTITPNATTSPDGNVFASRFTVYPNGYSPSYGGRSYNMDVCGSFFAKNASGGDGVQCVNGLSGTRYALFTSPLIDWTAIELNSTNNFGTNGTDFTPLDCRNNVSYSGTVALFRDIYLDFLNWEPSSYRTEPMPIGSTTYPSRRLSYDVGSELIASNGQIRMYVKMSPKFGTNMQVCYWDTSTSKPLAASGWYLCSWGTSDSNYIKIDQSNKVRVKFNSGAEYISTNALSFNKDNIVEIYVSVGNNLPSTCQYKVNGTVWQDLNIAIVPDAPSPGNNPVGLFMNQPVSVNGDTGQPPTCIHALGFFDSDIPFSLFTPQQLNLNNWLKDYPSTNASNWFGSPSQGQSGNITATLGAGSGASQTNLNGYKILSLTPGSGTYYNNGVNNFINATGWYFCALVRFNASTTDPGVNNRQSGYALFSDSLGNFGVGINNSGIWLQLYNGGYKDILYPSTNILNNWIMLSIWYDGTYAYISINNGSPFIAAMSAPTVLNGNVYLGASYGGGAVKSMGGDIAEVFAFNQNMSYLNPTIYSYLSNKYNITFGNYNDISNLPLNLWVSNYQGGTTWAGNASAGTSSSKTGTISGTAPSVGSLDGYGTAIFPTSPGGYVNFGASSGIVPLNGCFFASLVKFTNGASDPGYGSRLSGINAMASSGSYYGYGANYGGIYGNIYSTVYSYTDVLFPSSSGGALLNVWLVIFFWFDGSNVYIQVNNYPLQINKSSNLPSAANSYNFNLGKSGSFGGILVESLVATNLNVANYRNNIYNYFKNKYPSAGLP